MAGERIRKTREDRISEGIDQRIRGIAGQSAPEKTSSQYGTSGQVGTGTTGGIGTPPTDPIPGGSWIQWDLLAADAGGTAYVDLGLLADTGQVFILYQIVRGANKEIGKTQAGNDGASADTSGPQADVIIGGQVDVSFSCSIVSGRLRFTATANGTTGNNAVIRLTYLNIPSNS